MCDEYRITGLKRSGQFDRRGVAPYCIADSGCTLKMVDKQPLEWPLHMPLSEWGTRFQVEREILNKVRYLDIYH